MTAKKASLRCPECGFKAAHPMGLGRHRSAKHGVKSAREQYRRAQRNSSSGSRELRAVARRLDAIEQRHDRLILALAQAGKVAR